MAANMAYDIRADVCSILYKRIERKVLNANTDYSRVLRLQLPQLLSNANKLANCAQVDAQVIA